MAHHFSDDLWPLNNDDKLVKSVTAFSFLSFLSRGLTDRYHVAILGGFGFLWMVSTQYIFLDGCEIFSILLEEYENLVF